MAKIEPFVISREFDAPRERVWQAWTEVERLQQWFSPKGFTVIAAKLDLRPGGRYHYGLRAANGQEMWGLWTFREINAPERLVLVNCFSDAAGGITRHPMAPTWPREMLATSTFTEKAGRTTLTLEWLPLYPTPEELATFEAGRAGMGQGWTGTMEQLTHYLKKG
jgi:uncharacterized protein YndB with AHSA1/START domain